MPARNERGCHIGHRQAGADDQHARIGGNTIQRIVLPRPADVACAMRQPRADAGQPLRRQRTDGEHHAIAGEIAAIVQMHAEAVAYATDRDGLLPHQRQIPGRFVGLAQAFRKIVAVRDARQELVLAPFAQAQPAREPDGIVVLRTEMSCPHVQQMLGAGLAIRDAARERLVHTDQADVRCAGVGRCQQGRQRAAAESRSHDGDAHGVSPVGWAGVFYQARSRWL